MRRSTSILLGILTLTVGGMMYILYRTRSILIFHLADRIGLETAVNQLRSWAPAPHMPEWLIYSLPGGFWSAAYILVIDGVCRPLTKGKRLLWASVIPAMGLISELLQWTRLLPGTADTVDALCYAIPLVLYGLVSKESTEI